MTVGEKSSYTDCLGTPDLGHDPSVRLSASATRIHALSGDLMRILLALFKILR